MEVELYTALRYASLAPRMGRMGLSPKLAILAFLLGMQRPFCLAAMLRYSFTGAWLRGPFLSVFEILIDTAMSDE